MSTQRDKEIIQARVDQAVAEDVAVGMAAKATEEQIRADALAANNIRQGAHLEQVRAQRDAAAVGGIVARNDARSASFGFWLLLGLVGIGLLLGAIWFATRPEPSSTTTVINRTTTSDPAPAKAPVVAVPVQPAAPPPPAVVERRVPVVVERPVPVPAAPEPRQQQQQPAPTIIVEPAQPAPRGETSEPSASGESGGASGGSVTVETPGTGSGG